MAWLWDSWEEYVEWVRPSALSQGSWHLSRQQPWVEAESHVWEAVRRLTDAQGELHGLGFTGHDHHSPPSDPVITEKARRIVITAICSGEKLLLYHKRLAKHDASYGFVHQIGLLDHWDRYSQTDRIAIEIHQLAKDIGELIQGYQYLKTAEERFIVGDLHLPAPLISDFRLARNLFSVGFDEIGLLVAGRGLEGVLRKIADVRKINLEIRGSVSPASEADFHDLIEIMYRIRWKVRGTRLISAETRALLQFLRTLRNAGAHAVIQGSRSISNPRETAIVVADIANLLWQEATKRAKLVPTTVQKSW
jgi:hypothetical protein